MGVEPTIRPAKDRIAGFEGRGDHRTPFASGGSITGEKSGFGAGIWMYWRYAWTCRSLRGARLAAQALNVVSQEVVNIEARPGNGWRLIEASMGSVPVVAVDPWS